MNYKMIKYKRDNLKMEIDGLNRSFAFNKGAFELRKVIKRKKEEYNFLNNILKNFDKFKEVED